MPQGRKLKNSVFSGLYPGRTGGGFRSGAAKRNPVSSRGPETVRMMNIPKVTDENVTQPTPNETTRAISQ